MTSKRTKNYPAHVHARRHFECRRSIPQAAQDAHQWQPAIPRLNARFREHPLEKNISGNTHHQNQPALI